MFNLSKEEMINKKVENEAERMANKMMKDIISNLILGGDAPETLKLPVRIINIKDNIYEALHNLIEKHVVEETSEADLKKLKTIYEYLQMVDVGIKQFVETLENGEKEND